MPYRDNTQNQRSEKGHEDSGSISIGLRIRSISRKSPSAFVGAILLGLIILLALFGPLVVDADPTHIALRETNKPPGWRDETGQVHLLGTDHLGRDVPRTFNIWIACIPSCGISRHASRRNPRYPFRGCFRVSTGAGIDNLINARCGHLNELPLHSSGDDLGDYCRGRTLADHYYCGNSRMGRLCPGLFAAQC